MASKFFPVVPRVGRQLIQQIPKRQSRLFSAGPQRYSDVLAVVCSIDSGSPSVLNMEGIDIIEDFTELFLLIANCSCCNC